MWNDSKDNKMFLEIRSNKNILEYMMTSLIVVF